jgi:excisionase family DNA binding protein
MDKITGAIYPRGLEDMLPAEVRKALLTPEEFRKGLGNAIGRNTVYTYIRARKIKHVKIGRKILIPKSELVDFPLREMAQQAEQ